MTIFAKDLIKKIVVLIVTISLLLTFFMAPSAYAKLDIEDGEFYYSGTTKGTYTVTEGIFAWLLSKIGDIVDWLIGIMTMGFRMVFVGWTALIEKLLTWALETTTNINLDGELIENSTDLTALTDSSNNVTVEAIVYNKVPALDINFFRKYDPSEVLIRDGEAVSGTGAKLVCDVCGKAANLCDENCPCSKGEDCCDACTKYASAMNADPTKVPIIQQIRNELANWYTIMRLLAMAAMLVILIAIGIKMALSTVAAEKAVYKRMLVDWVVGMIILVGIHYMMLATISINEALVDIIHDTANKMNQEQMAGVKLMTLSEESGEADYTNNELEIKVYEEIRTRAYDPKLTVGLTGMVMYMTLVYFAIRYTIVYTKRYLTIMVLALMGPGLGVAYAMQKVFSGKSPAYSTWLKEFIMNTFIQSVHAILYAIFVSQALILSLDSLAGMIIALVFLNFALKADKLFRKIFKMGEGESLLGRTADAGDPDNMKQPFNAVKTFMKADATKQVAKTLVNTPYAKAIKGAGKVAVAGAATAATGLIMGAEKAKDVPGDIRSGMESLGESFERGIDRRLAIADQKGDNGIPVRVLRKIKGGLTKRKLDKNVANAADEVKNAETPGEKLAAMDKHNRATQKRDRVNNVVEQPNFVKIGVTRLTRSIDVRNTFNVSRSQSFGENAAAIYRGIFGTKSVNPKTGKLVSDKNGIYSKLSLSQVMGLEDKDKKALKQFTKFASSGLLGMAGMFVGMGTMVANPKIGLAMLTHGAYQTNRVFGLRAPNMQDYRNKKFTFGRFSEGALNNMRQTTIGLANQEMQAIGNGKLSEAVSRISTSEARLSSIESRRARKTIKDRFKTLKGSLKGKKSNMPGAISMKSQTLAGALNQGDRAYADAMGGEDGELVFVPKRRRGRYPVTNLGVAYDNMMKTFEKEADENFANVQKDYLQRVKTFEEEGKDIANVQLLLQYNRLKRKSQEKARKEMQGDALKEEYGRMGFVYDPATGKLTRTAATGEKSTDGSVEVKPKISKHDLYVSQTGKKNVNVGIRDTEKVEKINAEFDKAIATVAQGREIDVTDKKVYAQLVEQVSENLREAGILGEKQEAESLFKKGQLRKNIEAKAEYSNAKVSAVDRFLEVELSKAEVDAVKTALADTLGKDASEVSAEELYDAMRDSVPLTREELEERRDMYREEIQDAGFEIDEKTHQVVEQEREIEPDSELDIYTKHLVEAYALQGLVYDPKTGTVSDDPDKAPEAEKEEEEDGLAPATDGREISDVDRALAHTELDAIIMEMANGDFLDINDEKTMDEILRRLSNRLGKMGILKSDEVVTELFTKASLRREIKYKTKKANTKIEASKKYLEEALSEEEVSSVMSAIESLSEKSEEGTIITIEDVSREMSAQGTGFKDGPAGPTGPTGPTNPDADPRGPEAPVLTADEKKAVVEQYLSGMQEEVEKAEKVRNASERAEARVSEKVESDKIDKVPTLEKYLETRMAEDKLVEEEPQSSTKKKIDQIVQSGLEGYAEDKRGNRLLDFLASAEALMETGGEIETGDGSKVLLNPDEMAETRETLVIVEEMLSANRKQREKSEKKKYLPSISTLEAELNARREESLYESLVKSKGEGSREAVEAKEKMEAKKVAQEIAKKKDGLKADIAGPVFDIQSIVLNEKIAKKNKQRLQEIGSEDIRRKRPGTKRPGKKA